VQGGRCLVLGVEGEGASLGGMWWCKSAKLPEEVETAAGAGWAVPCFGGGRRGGLAWWDVVVQFSKKRARSYDVAAAAACGIEAQRGVSDGGPNGLMVMVYGVCGGDASVWSMVHHFHMKEFVLHLI
jgi:hypothetical protein